MAALRMFYHQIFKRRRLTVYSTLSVCLLTAFAPAQRLPEYQLKAVFLFNLTQFIEWPASAFPEKDTPMVIGILGDNPFNNYLVETVQGESVNDRPLIVEHYSSIKEVDTCHVLFINIQNESKMTATLASLKGKNILTVSDAKNFTENGGIIRFFKENNRIRFQINLDAAREADLTISSKLLSLAAVVTQTN